MEEMGRDFLKHMSIIYKLTSNKAKVIKAFKDPLFGFGLCLNQIAPLIKNDETFLKWKYYTVFHRFPNLKNPQTYNEKLQWLKLHDKRPEYTQMVDKAEAKKYVSQIIGEQYIIPTIGIYETFSDIDFNKLPNQFVIKCTHDSGGVVICKDKHSFNIDKARKKIEYGLGKINFWGTREYPYKTVKPRIIVEEYMEDESGYELKDYKIFCFDGKPEFLFVATDRGNKGEETKFDFFDLKWNHLPFTNGHPNSSKTINKPENFEKMVELARQLSQGIPHVRVDLYNISGKIYFGELTFFHWSGMTPFVPEEWDYKFGEMIHLPNKN